ncbi:MAG: uroporphyrinogen decarboxylase family protein [Coriobacteriales bacterium]|jgi:hypothetical protein
MERSINEKENALRALKRTGDVQWVPSDSVALEVIVASKMFERPPRDCHGMPLFTDEGKLVDDKDWFGVKWFFDDDSSGFAPDIKSPYVLDDITEWRDVVKFPDVDSIDWEATAKEDLASCDTENRLSVLFVESGPFERMHHLMGFENTFISMAEEPEEFRALADAIGDYKANLLDHMLSTYKPDMVLVHDDLGSAKGPFFSLDMYRELLKPAHMKIGETIDKYDVIHMHHSCGYMQTFIPDLLETGVDGFHPVQSCNNRAEVAKTYSDQACFWISIDAALDGDNSEEAVRNEVRSVIDTFGPYKNFVIGSIPNKYNERQRNWVADEVAKYGGSYYEGKQAAKAMSAC